MDTVTKGRIRTQNLVPAGVGTPNSFVEVKTHGADTVCFQVTGTYTGALSIQATVDGATWVTLSGATLILNTATSAAAATVSSGAQGIFQVSTPGFSRIRITALAAVTGAAVITAVATEGNSMIAVDTALPAGSAVIGAVTISGVPFVNSTPVAATAYSAVTAASTNAGVVKASAGNLFELSISNPTATAINVKLYNKASAPTVGTDVPVVTIPVPAGGSVTREFGALGKRFTTGIAIAATAGPLATDVAAAVAGVQLHGSYL